MASNYTVLGSFPITIVTSPSTSVDGIRINFQTIPSEVVAYANVPNTGGPTTAQLDAAQAAQLYIEPLALGIEEAMGTGRVASMYPTEVANAGGQYVDYMAVIVQYLSTNPRQPGPFQGEILISVFAFEAGDAFYGPLVRDRINAEYDQLVALANS